MPRNVEIKVSAREPEAIRARALALSDAPPIAIEQRDVFFRVATGRLKLRIFADGRGELISYERPDTSGPRTSSYVRAPVDDAAPLLDVLEHALGRRGEVRKRRTLVLVGQTRVHLDEVDGLGHFLELEVVLEPGQPERDGVRIAQDLMTALGLQDEQPIAGAYIDMLEGGRPGVRRG